MVIYSGLDVLYVNMHSNAAGRKHISLDYEGYNWTLTLPTELSAAAVLINYWYLSNFRIAGISLV